MCASLWSQTRTTKDFTEHTFEVFPLGNLQRLDIQSKHAQISLKNWDKDSISVETHIEILTDKPNLSGEMLDEIRINTVFYANTLQVKTNLPGNFNRTIPYKIKYNIFHPKKLALNIENSHGKVSIEQMQGGVVAGLSYCDIDINNLIPAHDSINNHIELLHCKGTISNAGTATVRIENSDLTMVSANKLKGSTAYSRINLNAVTDYSCSSNVDYLKIGTCQLINLKTLNSIIHVSNFGEDALFECEKGSLSIANPNDHFERLRINNHQCPTNIQLNPHTTYTINGDIKDGNFVHPVQDNLQVFRDNSNISISGQVGNDPDTETKVIVFNREADIEFY